MTFGTPCTFAVELGSMHVILLSKTPKTVRPNQQVTSPSCPASQKTPRNRILMSIVRYLTPEMRWKETWDGGGERDGEGHVPLRPVRNTRSLSLKPTIVGFNHRCYTYQPTGIRVAYKLTCSRTIKITITVCDEQ